MSVEVVDLQEPRTRIWGPGWRPSNHKRCVGWHKARKVGASRFERSTEIVRFRGLLFLRNQNDPFSGVMKSGSSSTTGDVQDSGRIPPRHFPKAKIHQKVRWLLYGSHWTLCNRANPPKQSSILRESTKRIENYVRSCSTIRVRPYVSQITVPKLNDMSVEVPHLPYSQTSTQPNNIFSGISITSSPVEPSPIRKNGLRWLHRIWNIQFLCRWVSSTCVTLAKKHWFESYSDYI